MKPGLSLGMGVPCPCHWCTNGMTHVWVSDFSHRLFDYGLHVNGLRGEWMHPRSVICYLLLSVIWWMWLCVQYTSFTTHWGHPSDYIWLHLIFWGLPSGFHMRRLLLLSDLFWACGDILNIRCYLNLDFELISSFYSWYITFTSIITLLNLYLYNVNIYTFWHSIPMQHILSFFSGSYFSVVISVH